MATRWMDWSLASAIWSFVRQYRRYIKTAGHFLTSYSVVVSCVFVGIMLWWFNGGESAYDPSYFLLLALLVIPSRLDTQVFNRIAESDIQDAGRNKQ